MADAGARFETFTRRDIDMAGMRATLKSAGVAAELRALAEQGAAQANSIASRRYDLEVPAYRAGLDQGAYTAIGVVHTASLMGRLDHSKNHTLNAINH